jgi:hypothetical protein
VTARERAALEEVEHAARSLRHDLFLVALSLDVILAECREALGEAGVPPEDGVRLVVVTRGVRS